MQQRDISWAQRAFCSQRANARNRGIAWEFTFEQWLAWWGDDIAYRGTSALSLQMRRVVDDGPYSPSNTVKTTAKLFHAGESERNAEAVIPIVRKHLRVTSGA